MKYFDPKKPVKISVDASSQGMGAVLLQEDRPVAYASKALTKSQQNNAQIEKEMLAIVFGCTRFHEFIFGLPEVYVETDHKPLEMILRKPLHQAPARLQRMILTIQKYTIKVHYRPGKDLVIADTLSRAFVQENADESTLEEFEVNAIQTLPISAEYCEKLKRETLNDPTLQQVKVLVEIGWPETKYDAPTNTHPFWNYRDEISTQNGILFRGPKVIVPKGLQAEMLQIIHSSHLGIEKCKRRARDVLFWPAMGKQIEDTVLKCPTCSKYRRQNSREPLIPHPIPKRPWARVAADLCDINGQPHLVLVDYYSGFIEVDRLEGTNSQRVIEHFKPHFAQYGIPDTLITDGGPQFTSDMFRTFSKTYNFVHQTSSPHYPQSNGRAEKAVQTVKRILMKAMEESSDPYLALLELCNTPINDRLGSPTQRLMGRRTKTLVPTSEKLLHPKTIRPSVVQQELTEKKQKQKYYYDQHSRTLQKLQVGDQVSIQKRGHWSPAVITGVAQTPHSYFITTPEGQTYRRNRRHIINMSGNLTHHSDGYLDNWLSTDTSNS